MANSHIKEAQRQKKGDRRISASNFGVMVDKVNANGKIPFAKEDIESVRQVGSHTEIVLRQKPLPTFFANAQQLGLDVDDNIQWVGANYYIADAPYQHDTSTNPHLVTFLSAGRYAVDVDVKVRCEVSTIRAAGFEMYVTIAALTNGDTGLSLSDGAEIIVAAPHELAHDHGAAVASDLTTYYHRMTNAWIFRRNLSLTFVIDPVEDLTNGELYFQVTSLDEDSRACTFSTASTLRIIKIA